MPKAQEQEKPQEKNPAEGLVRGRIVYYWPQPYEARYADSGPWPAMVTFIEAEPPTTVTLNVNLPEPTMVGADPVARHKGVPYSEEHVPGSWSWPDRA